jgi:hypothetical protein
MTPEARRRQAELRDREDRALFALRDVERLAWAEERRLEQRLRQLDARQAAVRKAIDRQRRGR